MDIDIKSCVTIQTDDPERAASSELKRHDAMKKNILMDSPLSLAKLQ